MAAVEHPLTPEELMEYLDGELSFERATIVQAHVAACARCQRLGEDLTGVSRDMAQWRVEDPPAGLRAPVSARESGQRSWFTWRSLIPTSRVAVVSGGAVIALIVIVTSEYRTSRSDLWVMQRYASHTPDDLPAIAGTEASRRAGNAGEVARVGGRIAAGQAAESVPPSIAAVRPQAQTTTGPLIVRTATLRLVAKDFDQARQAVDRIVREASGFVGQVQVTGVSTDYRVLRATLRVPAGRLDTTLAALKATGEVVEESQAGDDVTEQVTDLDARLANARNTEKRLIELLQKRTGDLADVLEAEREVSRVREEIERFEGQRKNLDSRVSYATVTLQVDEERKATLDMGPLTISGRLRNALVDGFVEAVESALGMVLFIVRIAPFLLLWAMVLAWPARLLLRRMRHART
jgi:hypothetical protein